MKKIILFTAFLAIFSFFLKPPTDPDLFWHLRYGEEILKTGQIPYGDQYSFTLPGYQWANSYWLSEVLIFLLVSKTGFLLPIILFTLLGAVTYLAVGFWGRLGKASSEAVASAAFLGAFVSWPILGLRPQTISLALLGSVFIIIHHFWQGHRPKLIFLLPVIFLFWANLHAGFILGLILIWAFLLADLVRQAAQKLWKLGSIAQPSLSFSQIKTLFFLNTISTSVTLVNPYGFGLWRTVLNDASSPTIKNQIAEWLAPNFHYEFGLIFFLYLLLLLFLVYLLRMRIHPVRLLILLLFGFLALAAVRHISVFALLSTPLLAEELTLLPWAKVNSAHKRLALVLFFGLLSLLWLGLYSPQIYQATRSLEALAKEGDYPYGAVEYLKKNPQERIFNEYGWGGYLIWQLPQNKTFIDGRMPGWRTKDKDILEDYGNIIDLKKDGPRLLKTWQIKTVLVSPDYPLVQFLKISPEWEKRYEDETAVIYTRK